MTRNEYNNSIKRIMERQGVNPEDLSIKWLSGFKTIKYPTGLIDKTAIIELSAKGYKTKTMKISVDNDGIFIR